MPSSGSPQEPRVIVAPPPTVGDANSRRAGYLALVASGLITATAFAGIADIATSAMPLASSPGPIQDYQRAPDGPSGDPYLVPGQPSPEQGGATVSGAASPANFAAGAGQPTPTTVIMTNPDGSTTTTVIMPDGSTTTTTTSPDGTTTTTTSSTSSGRSSRPTTTTTDSSTTTTSNSPPPSSSEPSQTTTTSDSTTTTTEESSTTSSSGEESSTSSSEPPSSSPDNKGNENGNGN